MENVNGEKILWPEWKTVRLIGRGSFGEVYEIQRQVFDDTEKAALKVISIPQNAGDIDEIGAQIGSDLFTVGSKVPGHPGNEIPLVLLGKFNDLSISVDGFPQFFQPFVRLPGYRKIGKNHSAVVRDIL